MSNFTTDADAYQGRHWKSPRLLRISASRFISSKTLQLTNDAKYGLAIEARLNIISNYVMQDVIRIAQGSPFVNWPDLR